MDVVANYRRDAGPALWAPSLVATGPAARFKLMFVSNRTLLSDRPPWWRCVRTAFLGRQPPSGNFVPARPGSASVPVHTRFRRCPAHRVVRRSGIASDCSDATWSADIRRTASSSVLVVAFPPPHRSRLSCPTRWARQAAARKIGMRIAGSRAVLGGCRPPANS